MNTAQFVLLIGSIAFASYGVIVAISDAAAEIVRAIEKIHLVLSHKGEG